MGPVLALLRRHIDCHSGAESACAIPSSLIPDCHRRSSRSQMSDERRSCVRISEEHKNPILCEQPIANLQYLENSDSAPHPDGHVTSVCSLC